MFVSVVMAVYNGARYLEQAISSILSQTHRNFELIIVNDASTDQTGAILEQVGDSRVKIINFPENRGAAAALNYGVEQASGDWIAIHDADDISFPRRLEEQVKYIKNRPHLVAAGSFIQCIADEDSPVSPGELLWFEHTRNDVQSSEEIRSGLYSGCPITHGTLFIDKQAFHAAGGYDPEFRIAYDYDLCRRLVMIGPMENVPQKLYQYRRHGDSLSAVKNLITTSKELFYSFSRYIYYTCFDHLHRVPVLAVCGSKKGTSHFARQAEPVCRVIAIYDPTPASLRRITGNFKSGNLDGAVVLDNSRYRKVLIRELVQNGMTLNRNLFLFWCRI